MASPATETETATAGVQGLSAGRSAKNPGNLRRWGPTICLVLLSASYFASTCLRAARQRLWFDEILTLDAASLLPSLSRLWSFLKHGLELNPPLGFIFAAASESIFGKNEFGLRFPSVVAFWIMCLCLYVFLRRRLPRPFAIIGMLMPVLTAAGRYSYEARPYALVLAFAGIALVAWQAAADGRGRRVALVAIAVALAAALCSQPLAVTLALPFVAGEATRSIQRKRLDVRIWCAFAAAIPSLWLLQNLKAAAGAASAAQNVVNPLYYVGLSYFLILMPAMIPVGATIFVALMSGSPSKTGTEPNRGMPGHELAALIGFAAIPFVAVPVSTLGGPYCVRYSLNAVIGFAGCLAVFLFRIGASRPRRTWMAAAGLFTLFFVADQLMPTDKRLSSGIEQSKASILQSALESAPRDNLPIVVGAQLAFLELEHYASPTLAGRLFYLTDPKAAARPYLCLDGTPCWAGSLLFDVNGPVLQKFFPFRSNFAEYKSFVAQHKRFLATEPGWVVPHLKAAGATIQLKGTVEGARYYEVTVG